MLLEILELLYAYPLRRSAMAHRTGSELPVAAMVVSDCCDGKCKMVVCGS